MNLQQLNLQALIALRKKKKIAQWEMAKALGISQPSYQRIEKGEIELKARHLPVIAAKLGFSSVSELTDQIFYEIKSA